MNNEVSKKLHAQDLHGEIWKDVVGFEEYYQVSSKGRVRSKDRIITNSNGSWIKQGKILRLKNSRGYHRAMIHIRRIKKYISVHRMVATSFIELDPARPHVNHIDGNPTNNCVENLEWCSPKENQSHARNVLKRRFKRSRPVFQFGINGDLIARYESVKDARSVFGGARTLIYDAISGKQKTAYGYVWSYNAAIEHAITIVKERKK